MIMMLLIAYLIGSIPSGYVLSKFVLGKDIRSHGSGNIGMTNAYRLGGKKIAALTLLGDAGKAVIMIFLAKIIYSDQEWMQALVAISVCIGHMFSVFLRFSGGKGVATCTGVLLILYPKIVIIPACVFFSTFYLTRYVSLASIISAIAALSASLIIGTWMNFCTLLMLTLLIIIKHRENIKRLLSFSENRL